MTTIATCSIISMRVPARKSRGEKATMVVVTEVSTAGNTSMVAIAENLGQIVSAACVCQFVFWAMGPENLLGGFNAVTGFKFDMKTFQEVGRRAWVLKRALNNLMGVTDRDDKLPKRVLTALTEGMAEGSAPDEALMKKEYYQIRGLNTKGFPTPELLDSLNLEFVKEKLY